MKAIVVTRYGPPSVLEPQETEKPVPDDDEVLVAVHAAVASSADCAFRQGKPFLVRASGRGIGSSVEGVMADCAGGTC